MLPPNILSPVFVWYNPSDHPEGNSSRVLSGISSWGLLAKPKLKPGIKLFYGKEEQAHGKKIILYLAPDAEDSVSRTDRVRCIRVPSPMAQANHCLD